MCFSCIAVIATRAQYYSGPAVVHAPVAYPAATYVSAPAAVYSPVNPNPSYAYKYGVSDPSTGDYKTAEESLSNGVVQGQYSLAESDGTVRTVSYTADDVHGFVAQVSKGSKVIASAAPVSAPVYAPAVSAPVYAAPAVPAVSYSPVYHAPAAPVSYPYPYKRHVQ